ncbi:hypothetical protein CHS0354_006653 [Potamilus streckersoni]|uniref:DUF7042 domain-containing protein n=1 Tax=Potamilus streckersoni TaxID=2493646 RepID=A0AAE0SXB4_9BIVA|nr:hypothetical protein CHS0354_006653 [Potamilus streckersoni]
MLKTVTLYVFLQAILQFFFTDGACTMPKDFQNSDWVDNRRGNITFTTWKMTGWGFKSVDGTIIDEWEIVDNVNFESQGYLALRSLSTFKEQNKTWYSYVCLNFTKVTDYSYMYYHIHEPEPMVSGERIKVFERDNLTSFTDICNTAIVIPEQEFSVMVRKVQEMEKIRTICPNPLLRKFDYRYYTSDRTPYCTQNGNLWDGCTDRTMMTFNYTACNKTMAYSKKGEAWCIASVTVKTDTYTMVYNPDDVVDNIDTFRFTCIVIDDDSIEASMSPQFCSINQTSYSLKTDTTGKKVGVQLTNRILESCPFTGSAGQKGEQNVDGKAIAIGVSVGVAVIAIAIVVIVVIIKKRRKTRFG